MKYTKEVKSDGSVYYGAEVSSTDGTVYRHGLLKTAESVAPSASHLQSIFDDWKISLRNRGIEFSEVSP
jgi:hypothetical protein